MFCSTKVILGTQNTVSASVNIFLSDFQLISNMALSPLSFFCLSFYFILMFAFLLERGGSSWARRYIQGICQTH